MSALPHDDMLPQHCGARHQQSQLGEVDRSVEGVQPEQGGQAAPLSSPGREVTALEGERASSL
jgi:hypothetical protein